MRQLQNLRAVSDDEELKHVFSFQPIAIGEEHIMYGKKYKAIDNYTTTIVTFEPVEEGE